VRSGILAVAIILGAVPAWAAGDGSFDPDQPFQQALSNRLLESLLNHAKEAIEDHFDISGNIGSEKGQPDRRQSFQFKFYPEGKSRSDQHFTAEGWFGPSSEADQQELHFRFALPNASAQSSQLPDNVL